MDKLKLIDRRIKEFLLHTSVNLKHHLHENKFLIKESRLLIDDMLENDNNIHSFVHALMYILQDIRRDKVMPNMFYKSPDIAYHTNFPIHDGYALMSFDEIIKYQICGVPRVLSKLNAVDQDNKFIEKFCFDAKSTSNFISYLVEQNQIYIELTPEINSNDSVKTCKYLANNPIHSFTDLGSMFNIIRDTINDILTSYTASESHIMGHLANHIHDIDWDLGFFEREKPKVTLKGGNVYKLAVEDFLRNGIENYNVPQSIIDYLGTLTKSSLSDWDFSISLPSDQRDSDLVVAENEILLSNDTDKAIFRRDVYIKRLCDDDLIEYTKWNDKLRKHLKEYCESENNAVNWKVHSMNCVIYMNNMLVTAGLAHWQIAMTPTQHIRAFAQDIGDQKQMEPLDENHKRSARLHGERNVETFKRAHSETKFHTTFEDSSSNLRVSDIEIWGIGKSLLLNQSKTPFVQGFDLVRLTLTFGLSISFDLGTGSPYLYKYGKTVFSELYDFSRSKPFTYIHLAKGFEKCDYDIMTYHYNDINGVNKATKLKSYSLKWFIEDIYRMSLEKFSRKHQKRLNRMMISLLLIANKGYISSKTKNVNVKQLMLMNYNITGRNNKFLLNKVISEWEMYKIKCGNECKDDIDVSPWASYIDDLNEYLFNKDLDQSFVQTGGGILVNILIKNIILVVSFIIIGIILLIVYNNKEYIAKFYNSSSIAV